MMQEMTLRVLEKGKPTASFTIPECNIFLQWHEVPNPTNGKLAERRKRWEEVLSSGNASPSFKD